MKGKNPAMTSGQIDDDGDVDAPPGAQKRRRLVGNLPSLRHETEFSTGVEERAAGKREVKRAARDARAEGPARSFLEGIWWRFDSLQRSRRDTANCQVTDKLT